MSLACSDCDAPHDFDLGPDDGTCIICGGNLVEDQKERELVGGKALVNAVVGAVNDGLIAANLIRGKAPHGTN